MATQNDFSERQDSIMAKAMAYLDYVDESIVAGDWNDAREQLDAAMQQVSYVIPASDHVAAMLEYFRIASGARVQIIRKAIER